jgi:tRNA dimethylallyltransferase
MARVWLIAGPTASGKSGLALRLAQATGAETSGAEIINADSMQLYADLRVLTARPSVEQEAQARHHLYGVADAAETWSVGAWLRAATTVLTEIAERDRPAIIVGGTGLYFSALTQGLAEIPAIAEAVRAEVRERLDRLGEDAFREALAGVDAEAAARIAPGDRQRLGRAMEVATATGRSLTAWQASTTPLLATGAYRALVLDPPRDALYARCDARLGAMATDGGLDEVAALMARRLDPQLPAMKALGVREFARHLAGELTLDQALSLARQETRRYAKRQITWFRNQTPHWPRTADPSSRMDAP